MSQSWWQLDWVWTATGWSLAALGAVLLLWALFWDHARGRKRCPKCWYDMAGVPGLKCPECGHIARREAHFGKTRRRWRVGFAAVALGIMAMQVADQPKRRGEHRLLCWVPTVALAAFADLEPGPAPTGLSRSLWLRGSSLQVWDGAIIALRERAPTDSTLKNLVKTRTVWPVSSPVQFQLDDLNEPPILVGNRTTRAQVRCGELEGSLEKRGHAPDIGFVCRMGSGWGSATTLSMNAGKHIVQVEGSVERSVGGFSWTQRQWKQSLDVRVVATIAEAIPGRDSAELQTLVRSSLVAAPESGHTVMVWWSPRPYTSPPGGFFFELIRGDEVLDSGESADGCIFLRWGGRDDPTPEWAAREPVPCEVGQSLWLRVRGDARSSLGVSDREWYWSGAAEVCLQELLDRRDEQRSGGK